jgi:hypothetical protein
MEMLSAMRLRLLLGLFIVSGLLAGGGRAGAAVLTPPNVGSFYTDKSTVSSGDKPDDAQPYHDLANDCNLSANQSPGFVNYLTVNSDGSMSGRCAYTNSYSGITETADGTFTGSVDLETGEGAFTYDITRSFERGGDNPLSQTHHIVYSDDGATFTASGAVATGHFTYSCSSSGSSTCTGASSGDSLSYSGTITYHIGFQPLASVDLSIDHIEVVQVVQDAGNTVPLVARKSTVARVFVKGTLPVVGPQVTLKGRRGGELGGTPVLLNGGVAGANPAPVREITNHSFNYLLPDNWVTEGTLTLEAEAKPPEGVSDPNTDNDKGQAAVMFQERRGLIVAYLPVCYQPPGQASETCPSDFLINSAHELMAKIFPAADGAILYRPLGVPRWVWTMPIPGYAQERQFIASVRKRYDLIESTDHIIADQLAAWLPAIVGAHSGLSDPLWAGGDRTGHVSYETDDTTAMEREHILAHEIAHNLGGRHTNRNPSGCNSNDPNTDWPPEYTDSTIHEIGFDVETRRVVPATKLDVMSYCSPPRSNIWMSPFTYRKLFNGNFQPQSLVRVTASAAATQYLIISGSAKADGSGGTLEPAYVVTSNSPGEPSDPNATHCLRFSPSNIDYCFTLEFESHFHDAELTDEAFSLKVPLPAGATRVALMAGSTELASLQASASAPSLQITSPASGDHWQGSRTVTWSASDGDGDPLTYAVLYSPDGGNTWLPIDVDGTAPQFSLDTGSLDASANGMFRVIASDGLNSTEVTVDNVQVGELGQDRVWADVDCSGGVAIGDAQKIARSAIGLPVNQTPPCPAIGADITVDGNPGKWADVDCNGGVAIGDAQKIARSAIGLAVNQTPPCPVIGHTVRISAPG